MIGRSPILAVLLIVKMSLVALVPTATAQTITIRDDTGATLRLTTPARRIVSLAPGATEMLFAAGAGDRVLATVTGADAPEAAKKIERIGDANALVFDRLIALKPDAVVVWKDLTNELVIDSLVNKLKLNVYYVSVRTLDDIPQSVRRLGFLRGRLRLPSRRHVRWKRKSLHYLKNHWPAVVLSTFFS